MGKDEREKLFVINWFCCVGIVFCVEVFILIV